MILARIGFAAPVALAVYALVSHAILLASGTLPVWLGPAALAAGFLVGAWMTRELVSRELPPAAEAPDWRFVWVRRIAVLGLFATVAVVSWGAVATGDREWDGLVSWSSRAQLLIPPCDLSGPFFVDSAVFSHSFDYPLLQPLCLGACQAFAGRAGRLFFPVLFVLLLSLCWAIGRRLDREALKSGGRRRREGFCGWGLAAGVGLTPMWAGTGSGAVDSGYAELFVAYLLTVGAAGLRLHSPILVAVSAFCLPLIKPEGLPWAVLVGLSSALASAPRARSVRWAGALGLSGALLLWLPLQAQLGQRAAPSAFWAGGPLVLILAAGALQDRWRLRLRSIVGLGVLVGVALLGVAFAVDLRASSVGLVREFGGNLTELQTRLQDLPELLGGYLGGFFSVRKLGLLFVILPLAGVVAWRGEGSRVERSVLMLWIGGMVVSCLAILLGDDTNWEHVFKSRFDRLLLQWVGVGWILFFLCLDLQKTANTGAASFVHDQPKPPSQGVPSGGI